MSTGEPPYEDTPETLLSAMCGDCLCMCATSLFAARTSASRT
eukprot:CAMPEP_0206235552 /NCGR_PEP_ID=MMETSP0047_2-20121206/13213_1 /ASSEMBLY_ACC=CAM_ASM_000192 /TAXON_ID=195065 /ORGANISM="Chroomonas mesostigmatica_cf, Strain CCMP1168" /LENGTH=41 /DNA_ID= /DNA_START= /DNA_END= /DNA_ORIENTATION=